MTISAKRMTYTAVLVMLVLGVVRAATFRFRDAETAFRQTCSEELKKLGITRGAAKAKYPTPYVTGVSGGCVLPGGTAEVVVKGKFVPGTKFFFENDNLEVVKESLVGGEYRATVKAAPGIGPQHADLMVITPVTAISAQHSSAVIVGGKFEWTMETANGWKVVARALGETKGCSAQPNEGNKYELLFYRANEPAPFEKRSGSLSYSMWSRTNYSFQISEESPDSQAGIQNMQTLMQRMGDPKLTNAQREALMKEMEKMQANMQADLKKRIDPAYIKAQEEKKQQFGCSYIEIAVPAGATSFTGQMRCAQKVGNQIKLTGSMKML